MNVHFKFEFSTVLGREKIEKIAKVTGSRLLSTAAFFGCRPILSMKQWCLEQCKSCLSVPFNWDAGRDKNYGNLKEKNSIEN